MQPAIEDGDAARAMAEARIGAVGQGAGTRCGAAAAPGTPMRGRKAGCSTSFTGGQLMGWSWWTLVGTG